MKPAVGSPTRHIFFTSLLTLLSLTSGFQCLSQEPLFNNQQNFGVEDGLPQSYISGIIQDDDGFIWLATLDGLSRYDGRSFKNIRYRPNDSLGISANSINNFGPLVNNNLTIYYSPVVADNFNLRTFKVSRNTIRNKLSRIPNIYWQTFITHPASPNWVFMMADWKGIGWMNKVTGNVHYATKANGRLHADTVSVMYFSPEGILYLVSENGIQVSDTSLHKFEFIPFQTGIKKRLPVIFGEVFGEDYSIAYRPDNSLAIAYLDTLVILDLSKKTRTIHTIPHKGVPSNGAMLQLDPKGRAYFTSYGSVYRLTEQGELKVLWENTINPGLRISAIFIDRSDVLWVSVNAQGLLKIDLQASPFVSYKYKTNFMSDILERAGANQGLMMNYWIKNEGSYYFRQAYDSKGNLYACYNRYNENQVYQLNKKGIRTLPYAPNNSVYSALFTTPDDELWIFDSQRFAWFRWRTPDVEPDQIQLDATGLDGIEMADAKFAGGFIWLSTYNHGLLKYVGYNLINRFTGQLDKGVMPKSLTEICLDPLDKNRFWVGSRGGGLILWDVRKGLQRIYTMEDGLPNNTIYCILPDKTGKIWCSTNKGIFRFDVRTGKVTAFEKTDGLPGNEFNRAHKFMFPDGRLSFGGLDGYTIFNPGDFENNNERIQVPVVLTNLQVNNKPQDMNIAGSDIEEPLSTIKVIDLPYNKNSLRFEFAAMVFNQSQKIRYRYRLEGADEEWIENGTNNIASYSALRPGDYTLCLNATDNYGEWSSLVKEIKVNIHPPFWATWWAYGIYLLIGAGLIRWYFIYREQRLKNEQKLAFEKREAIRLKEVDELKDRFFSNITHEFRTPLTLIINPLEKLEHDPSLSVAAVNSVKTAQRNSQQLLRLINEFLDFSKMNNGQLKLRLSRGELELFTRECVHSFQAAAMEKSIGLSFSSNGIHGHYLFDEEKWEKIISNLLSNALKFTPAGGAIAVSISQSASHAVQFEVKDSGPGIPVEHQQKIFDRFYQVDDSAIRNYGGTGIGLSLVKELTELMQGSVFLDSMPGGPTLFTVTIPVKKMEDESFISIIPAENGSETHKVDLPLILVVEDNDELRAFLVDSMVKHYRVLEAPDGLKAWEIILQELPDIIISDIMMPGRDGFEMCRMCKSDNRTAHICFILLTSKAAHEARLKGLGTGADDYITKPFNQEELELRIANLLYLQRKQRTYLQAQLIPSAPTEKLPVVANPFLLQLYKEIDAKLEDGDLGVDYLCKIMAMSRSTLNRKLKSLLDISANDLVRQYRLQKATSLLSTGTDITTVSYKVGFSSPSYFSQCFKEQYGITPSDYVSRQN